MFKFTAWVKDAKEKESVTEYIMENKDSMCFSTENYIMTTLTNLEENESISINKSIEEVWTFIAKIKNQIYFYPNSQSISIKELEENEISIEDEDNKTKATFRVAKKEFNSDKKQLELELIGANVSLLGQRLEINVINII